MTSEKYISPDLKDWWKNNYYKLHGEKDILTVEQMEKKAVKKIKYFKRPRIIFLREFTGSTQWIEC